MKLMEQETYNPGKLLNAIMYHLKLKNDAALARTLHVAPPVISKIRSHRLPIGAFMLIRMHEVTNFSISELRACMGDTRPRFYHSKEKV